MSLSAARRSWNGVSLEAERVAFFADGRRLAIADTDGEVEIRDLTYFNRHITGHAGYFYAKLCAAPGGLAPADGIPYGTGPCGNPVAGVSGPGSSR